MAQTTHWRMQVCLEGWSVGWTRSEFMIFFFFVVVICMSQGSQVEPLK